MDEAQDALVLEIRRASLHSDSDPVPQRRSTDVPTNEPLERIGKVLVIKLNGIVVGGLVGLAQQTFILTVIWIAVLQSRGVLVNRDAVFYVTTAIWIASVCSLLLLVSLWIWFYRSEAFLHLARSRSRTPKKGG